ncbi:MAG: 50S ribosomal protein L24 [Chlamydiae bacterium]|nr:50S ribosomal protein L24 [Chlamydiota bacterium]
MGTRRFRPNDEVMVIAGNDRGRSGKILSFKGERVIVEGINVRKKHMKPTQQNQKGEIIDIECSVHISNIKPFVDGKAVKIRARFSEGKKELYYKDGEKEISHRFVRK